MRKLLLAGPDMAVAVRRYAGGERHGRHTDQHSRVSVLLRGGYREDSRAGSTTVAAGDIVLKSNQAEHEDAFCDDGATLLVVEFHDDNDAFTAVDPRLWRKRSDGGALHGGATLLESALASDANSVAQAANDLLASCVDEPARRTSAPGWLDRLRQQLEQTSLASVDVAAHARSNGAHPAHASRLFRRCYGASITAHAQSHSVRRALSVLGNAELPLSDIALAAGFYDQSHMSRVFRRVTGRTPGAHRAMLAAALG